MRQQDEPFVIRSTCANTRRTLKSCYDHRQNCALYVSPTLGLGTGLNAVTTDPSGARNRMPRVPGWLRHSELAWLLAQTPATGERARRFGAGYEAAGVPLAWRIDAHSAVTGNRRAQPVVYRAGGLRRPSAEPRKAITEPLTEVHLQPRRAAARLVDVWPAALWSRTRTVFQIEQPNLDECWQCDFCDGLQMAAIGVRPGLRSTLEATYGYLLLANGMLIGYGGFTTLFAQVNTCINVFPEYCGGEAAFAFEQALRAMHSLAGCAHVIVNPYQFGAGNDEALASGAYWFYYRLGFRSVEREVHALARREVDRLRANRGYRVPIGTLRRLAACDLCLDLADSTDVLFDEAWLPAIGRGITEAIACVPEVNRARALAQLTRQVCAQLDVDPSARSARERAGLAQFAPILAQVDDLASWPAAHKRAVVELACLRQAATERHFVAGQRRHDRLRLALAQVGRRAIAPVCTIARRDLRRHSLRTRAATRKRRAAHAARLRAGRKPTPLPRLSLCSPPPWPLRSSLRPRAH